MDELLQQFGVVQGKLDRLLAESTAGHERFLGVAAAAQYSSLSVESIRRMIASGKITALRPVRGKILVDKRELENVILSSTSELRFGRGRRKRA